MTREKAKEKQNTRLAFALVAICVSMLAIWVSSKAIYGEERTEGPSVEERIHDIETSTMPEMAKQMALARLRSNGAPPPSGPAQPGPSPK